MNNIYKYKLKKTNKKTYHKHQTVYEVDFKTKTLLASYSFINGKMTSSVGRRPKVKVFSNHHRK